MTKIVSLKKRKKKNRKEYNSIRTKTSTRSKPVNATVKKDQPGPPSAVTHSFFVGPLQKRCHGACDGLCLVIWWSFS
uniref:Uncharacterized protein n=1 Tax=Anguilla anguilla TaxID=7936 RepID=A0A0E9X4G1_ANGAN